MNAVIKPKKCRVCRREFAPRLSTQVCCSPTCAISYARHCGEKRQSLAMQRVALAEKREAKERLKTRRDYEREAQRAFNQWVRWRDRFDGCISCHMPATYQGQWHASHYRSTGAAPELRFDERNVHKACAQCNSIKSGNVVEYRIRLVQKIGLEAVEWLEGPHEPKKYTVDELKEIRRTYSRRLRDEQRRAL